jgi:hypothetical protein
MEIRLKHEMCGEVPSLLLSFIVPLFPMAKKLANKEKFYEFRFPCSGTNNTHTHLKIEIFQPNPLSFP